MEFKTAIKLGTIATGTIEGGISSVEVLDSSSNDVNVISKDDIGTCKVHVSWGLKGTLLDSVFLNIPGDWVVKAYIEGWGDKAQELDLDSDNGKISVMGARDVVKGDSAAGTETQWNYKETITLPSTLEVGMYKLAVSINYVHPSGDPGQMAGFIEHDSMLQIFEPN